LVSIASYYIFYFDERRKFYQNVVYINGITRDLQHTLVGYVMMYSYLWIRFRT